MVATLVGFSDVFHYAKGDYDAMNVYIVRDPTPRENIHGKVCQNIFLRRDEVNLFPADAKVGKQYEFIYDSTGRYSFLSKIVPHE